MTFEKWTREELIDWGRKILRLIKLAEQREQQVTGYTKEQYRGAIMEAKHAHLTVKQYFNKKYGKS